MPGRCVRGAVVDAAGPARRIVAARGLALLQRWKGLFPETLDRRTWQTRLPQIVREVAMRS